MPASPPSAGSDRPSTTETGDQSPAAVEVRYVLDTVTNAWMAQTSDAVTGAFVERGRASSVRHHQASDVSRGVDDR